MNYETGDALDGTPSDQLVKESEAAAPTGAVCAYLDDAGVFQYVADCDEEHFRRNLHRDVITVYVE